MKWCEAPTVILSSIILYGCTPTPECVKVEAGAVEIVVAAGEGGCSVRGDPIPCSGVGKHLREQLEMDARDQILLSPDRQADYTVIGSVIESIQNAGFVNLAFSTAQCGAPTQGGT